ncbi:hypothetical protein AB4458_27020 [Vibrio sp. 10N.261.45.F1]|uniref:hypothetical protein n=1 Tax=unclassified Vibrio TaxID=2614977 RepID=UPI0035519F3F
MSKRTYDWKQGGTQYRLAVDEIPSNYSVYLALGDDVSVLRNNPITIHIRFDKLDDHDCRCYQMTVDGITVKNIAYADAVTIAKTLNCELTEQCDKCQEVAPLTYSLDLDYTHVCMDCH